LLPTDGNPIGGRKKEKKLLRHSTPPDVPANPNFRHNKSGMNLKLFVDIDNRKLVKSKTSDFPVNLAMLFREDWK